MKILYITCANVAGGANIALVNILKGMIANGHEVMTITVTDDGPLLGMLSDIGCPYRQLRMKHDVYPRNKNILLYLPRLLWTIYSNAVAKRKIQQIIKTFQPDIVHTNVGTMGIGYDVCHKLHIPHVWHIREYQDLDFGYHYFPTVKTFMKKSHAEGNYNIVITKGIFEYRHFRPKVDKVIYDGVFSEKIAEKPLVNEKDDYLLFVGRVEPAKGALDLMKAFADFHAKYPSMKLKIAGAYNGGAYYQSCLDLLSKCDLTDSVEFLGSRSDVYELMAHARMLVVPSRFEGFGFITAEAMVNNCPVIGRNTAGTKEQFDKGLEYTGGEIGLRFNTQEEMLKAMVFVMENDCKDMCQRAYQTVLHYYTLEESTRNVLDFYKSVIAGKEVVS